MIVQWIQFIYKKGLFMLNMSEDDLKKVKSILFIGGGVFAAVVGVMFSSQGFAFEMKGMEWIGIGLGVLCFIVQIAFSSQLAYSSYNYVIFSCGVLAYVYSGWSNWQGIMAMSPSASPWFAFLLGEFIDLVAEPLIVFGMIGVSANGEGDFLRNLLGMKAGKVNKQTPPPPTYSQSNRPSKYVPEHKPGPSFSSKPSKDGFYSRAGGSDDPVDFDTHVEEFRNIMRDK
jgi:hypothetical protein